MKAKAALMSFILMVMLPVLSSSALAGCFFGRADWSCAGCLPRCDFGSAFMLARDGEILHPSAGTNLRPVTGLDGRAAENAVQKYIDSFSKSQEAQAPSGFTSFAVTPYPGGTAP